jgi:hypothetical protein
MVNKYLSDMNKVILGNADLSILSEEYQEYENSVLKESEKELLLLLDISEAKTTYHCTVCNTEVSPNFPTPVAYCILCNDYTTWKKNCHWEQNITFDQLTKFTFNRAKEIISHMSLSKRINILKELDKHLLYLYQSTKQYNDQMFGKSLPPKTFLSIMGKIKHLEILQLWLYGID